MAKRILLIWLLSEFAFMVTLAVFDHEPVKAIAVASYSVQWLLFIVSVAIIFHEPSKKNRYIFLNFALFFSVSILFHCYNFIGHSFLVNHPFARAYFTQYVSLGGYFLLLVFSLAYLAIDALFRDFKTAYKYLLTLGIVGGFFVYYYHGYISNPDYVYTTSDVHTWKSLNQYWEQHTKQYGVEPSIQTLAEMSDLKLWKDNEPIGSLFPAERLRVAAEFYPYLLGTNYKILLLRPLYMNTIYMCVLSLAFVLLFFGYQYMKDPPQGAYIDKIMFLFLVFSTMEIMHAWSFVKSVEWGSFYELANIGNAVSLGILLLIAMFFSLRLKFIRSVKGEFYEQEILASPASVTRWRDALDDLLVAQFFNRKKLVGRLFLSSTDVSYEEGGKENRK